MKEEYTLENKENYPSNKIPVLKNLSTFKEFKPLEKNELETLINKLSLNCSVEELQSGNLNITKQNSNNSAASSQKPTRFRQMVSPLEWKLYNTLPNSVLWDKLAIIKENDNNLYADIVLSLGRIYYVVTERQGSFTTLTAGGATIYEQKTGKLVGGREHHVKAANHYNMLSNLLKEFEKIDKKELTGLESRTFESVYNYLKFHHSVLGNVLKQLPVEKKAHIKHNHNLDCDLISKLEATDDQKHSVEVNHRDPKFNDNKRKTPTKLDHANKSYLELMEDEIKDARKIKNTTELNDTQNKNSKSNYQSSYNPGIFPGRGQGRNATSGIRRGNTPFRKLNFS